MFVIYQNETAIDVSENIRYVKSEKNKMLGCTQDEATFVYCADSDMFYGLWDYTVVETDTVPDGVTVNTEKRSKAIRTQREQLLTACDWTQCLDAPIDTDSQTAYRTYRQALRDITEQEGFPFSVVFPELPEVVKADPDPVDTAVDALLDGEVSE